MMSLLIIANVPTGTTHEHYEFSNPLNLDEDELERVNFNDTRTKKLESIQSLNCIYLQARRQSPTGDYIVEVCIVSDNAQYHYYQSDISRTVTRAIAVANEADRIYSTVNVRIVLVCTITWTSGDQSPFSSSPETTLHNFRTYTLQVQESFDAIMLLT
jgi:hypothetical protein